MDQGTIIGGCLSIFGAIILLTILAAQLIRRRRNGAGPVRDCFCLLLAVGTIQLILYGWGSLSERLDKSESLVFTAMFIWSICLGMCLLCRLLCLLFEYCRTDLGSQVQGEACNREEAAEKNRAGRIVLMCQYAAYALGGLVSTICLFAGWPRQSMQFLTLVGIAVFLSCWVLLIKNRRLAGIFRTGLLMILLPLPLAAFIFQWYSGGIPVIGTAVTLRIKE